MVRVIVGIFFILHGLIHLIGFLVPWKIVKTPNFPYSTTILAGKVDIGELGARIWGVFWLLGVIGFVAAGIGLLTLAPWWQALTLGATIYSLVLCILGWPDSQFGVYINIAILALLALGGRFGWLP